MDELHLSSSSSDSSAAGQQAALSVSAAMARAKQSLEDITVRILGEVSELSNKPGYKAVYFTVKDQSAALPCMMWNNRYKAAGVNLRIGALVEITGRFTLYAPKGRMNFDVFSIALAGEGTLRMQVAALARKLQAEGLTDQRRKRRLPDFPETIGVVTSPRGAAVHDVLRTLRRRYPLAQVLLAGVPVEGATAHLGIIEGLREVVRHGAEVVLVVRGGGSFEDLMPFNDEALARAIASSPVPVVTGIGHEPDTSIADMVADVRASTPTAAAETVAPSRESIDGKLVALGRALHTRQRTTVDQLRVRLDRMALSPLFQEPERLFEREAQQLDDLAERLAIVLPESLARDKQTLEQCRNRLTLLLPQELKGHQQRLVAVTDRFTYQGETSIHRFRQQVSLIAARLHDLSPLAVLGRGYAIARTEAGRVLRSVGQVKRQDPLTVVLSDGRIHCVVHDVQPEAPHETTKEELR